MVEEETKSSDDKGGNITLFKIPIDLLQAPSSQEKLGYHILLGKNPYVSLLLTKINNPQLKTTHNSERKANETY